MKLLKNSTYEAMLANAARIANTNFDLTTQNDSLKLQVKNLQQRNDELNNISTRLVKNETRLRETSAMLKNETNDVLGILGDTRREIAALKKERKTLKCKLTKAQKNDMPKDAKTGKFVKKPKSVELPIKYVRARVVDSNISKKNPSLVDIAGGNGAAKKKRAVKKK